MCKDLKTNNFAERNNAAKDRRTTTTTSANTISHRSGIGGVGHQRSQPTTRMRSRSEIVDDYSFNVDANQHRPTSFDIPLSNHFGQSAAQNLKFVLYIYEVKKMRDIYGRVTMALDVIKQKRSVVV